MMKNFRVCNNDLNHWVETKIVNSSDVIDFLKRNSYFSWTFDIAWKTPVTGEYATIVNCEDGFVSFNRNFKIPSAFKKLI